MFLVCHQPQNIYHKTVVLGPSYRVMVFNYLPTSTHNVIYVCDGL